MERKFHGAEIRISRECNQFSIQRRICLKIKKNRFQYWMGDLIQSFHFDSLFVTLLANR